MNVQHQLEQQISWNETMQESVSDLSPNESLHQVHFCKSLCWKKVFTMHSWLLQQEPYIGIAMSVIHTVPFTGISPSVCIESSQKDRGFDHFSSEPRRLVEKMSTTSGGYRLASSTSPRSFPVWAKWFSSSRSFQDCRLSVAFKSSQKAPFCADPLCLSRCVGWIADGVSCLKFSERTPLPKALERSLATHATTDARLHWLILRVS